MEILEKLFGSQAKVKIMRLFLFNSETAFDLDTISGRALVSRDESKKEVLTLERIGMIKKKIFTKEIIKKHNKNNQLVRVKASGWVLDDTFFYLVPLQNFLIHINPFKNKDIIEKIGRAAKLKLLIISGVFIQQTESRIDLLIVGDNIRKSYLESTIKAIESEMGKELRYAFFETSDFQYRLGMCDKLVRDILDYPHEKIVDKLNVR